MLDITSIANAQDLAPKDSGGNRLHHRHWGNALEHMTKNLDLTAEQQAKIRPILEQARPQIVAARQEARQKMKAIRDNIRSQVRPLLTQAQQAKLDAMHKARDDMRKAREAMREAAK